MPVNFPTGPLQATLTLQQKFTISMDPVGCTRKNIYTQEIASTITFIENNKRKVIHNAQHRSRTNDTKRLRRKRIQWYGGVGGTRQK